jgi:tetratricopeptide (TPR) repeat protein
LQATKKGETDMNFLRELFGKKESESKPIATTPTIKSPPLNIATGDIQKALAVLESAHLTRYNEDLERRVDEALDDVAARGEVGSNALMGRLYKDMKMSNSSVEVYFGGDLAWNEWMKKRAIVYAFGRARIRGVVPQLISLVSARSRVQQFYEILQPAAATALGEIGDKQAIEPLHKCLRNDDVSNETKRAIGEALEKLEGQPVLDPALIIAKADRMNKEANGEEVLQLLAQIDSSMFDSLTELQKYYTWYMRGLVYKLRGDKVKAIDCFQMSLKYFNTPEAMAHKHLAELK